MLKVDLLLINSGLICVCLNIVVLLPIDSLIAEALTFETYPMIKIQYHSLNFFSIIVKYSIVKFIAQMSNLYGLYVTNTSNTLFGV